MNLGSSMVLDSPVLPLSSQICKWKETSSTTPGRYRHSFKTAKCLSIHSSSSYLRYHASTKRCVSPLKQSSFRAWHVIRAEKQSISASSHDTPRKKKGFPYETAQKNYFRYYESIKIETYFLYPAIRKGYLSYDRSLRKKNYVPCKAIQKDDIPKEDLNKNYLPLSRTFHLIIPFLSTQWKLIMEAWAFTLISVFSLFALVSESGKFTSIISKGDINHINKECIYMASLLILKSVSKFLQQTFLAKVSSNVTYDVRRHVFNKVIHNYPSYFDSKNQSPSGDIAYRITSEAEDIGDLVYSLLETLIPNVLQLVVVSIKMMMLSRLLSIIIILVVPCMSLIVAGLGEKLKSISREGQDTIAKLSSYLNEILVSMFIVKTYSAEGFEQSRFEKLASADAKARLKKKRMKAFIPEAVTAIYATMALVFFSVASWAMSCGSLAGPNVVSFMTSLVLLIDPIQAVGKSYNELKQGEPAIEHLFELIPSQKVTKRGGSLVLQHIHGDVKFCSVTFKYGDALPNILTSISFHIQAGETVALVGPSGGGKTTIAKLLLGLYEPTEGSILIDGYDIKDMNEKTLRQHVTIVPQNVDLFSGTVAENIAYGENACSDRMEQIKQAAMLANAHHFIEKLPNSYSTELTNSASCLSGGQRQRLSIARAIYRQSSILILDEATSALDNISEKLVKDALQKCMMGRTMLVIAHRLETIRRADKIYFLKDGRVMEQGTHLSLIALGGHYASLYGVKEAT